MIQYILTLAYDGTAYFGWQQTQMGPSIQESLEKALQKLSATSPLPEAASRTDRGVHAEGQVVSIQIEDSWDLNQLKRALNAHLPADIRVLAVQEASADFHPTLHAKHKEYRYRLCLAKVQDPIHRLYSWAFRPSLCLEWMDKATKTLLGTQDFSTFTNKKQKNPICTIDQILLHPLEDERLEIVITGDRFLYKMVRNLVGTLLFIGQGKLPVDCIPSLLASKDRKQAAVAAPAHGLTLFQVIYAT